MKNVKAKIFDNTKYQIEFFRIFLNESNKKWFNSISEIAKNVNIPQPELSNIFSWKKWLIEEKFNQLMGWLWFTDKDVKEIERKAKDNLYRREYWKEINNLPLDWIDLTDFEKEELWKILFSKVVWVEPTKEDVEVMLEMIRMSNRNKK